MNIRLRLTKKKECTVLTWPAKIILFAALTVIFLFVSFKIPLFLSLNNPINGKYLVLDGIMPDYSIQRAIEIFNNQNYTTIVATGSKLEAGYFISEKSTMAELTYATFVELGFDSTKIIVIPEGDILKDRTYTSALSLKKYFEKHQITNAEIDILAIGCHARRSKMLFKLALGDNFNVGVYALPDNSFDINRWWKTSKGVRTVISETIGYFYAKVFFYPDKNE